MSSFESQVSVSGSRLVPTPSKILLKDRLSTRGLLRRKNMELPNYNCVLCSANTEETVQHLFLQCPFAQHCRGFLHLYISDPDDPFSSLESLKLQLNIPFFTDVVIILCWVIWMARNDLIFRDIQPMATSSKSLFFKEFALVTLRAKRQLPDLMSSWIDTFM